MSGTLSIEEIRELWESFKIVDPVGGDEISLQGLRSVLESMGHKPTDEQLRHILLDADASGPVTFDKFAALLTSLRGDSASRLRLAFEVLDETGTGLVTREALGSVLSPFGLADQELDQILAQADRDGDGAIDFDEFSRLMPSEHETGAGGYRDAHRRLAGWRSSESASAEGIDLPPAPPLGIAEPERTGQGHGSIEPGCGTSRLQMQIGLFRLLQGAAYRSFRENFCAHHETHLRAKKLPYTILQFVDFVNAAIGFYKALGVVEPTCFPALDAVTASVNAEYQRLQERIANWPDIEKTPEMQATAAAMQRERSREATIAQKFAAGVELALTLRKKDLSLAELAEDLLASHELSRLRRLELHDEMASAPEHDGSDPKDYLKSWNRVVLESVDEDIDGAMMPAAYWYEDFMPKLLAAFSVATGEDLTSNSSPDEPALDAWFEATREAGEFAQYAPAVAECFPGCGPNQKLELKQAWRLTRHYLNGVQKRREREEYGRESGFLSQYVAFLDVYLGRSDVRDAQMRVSFPYFLGPPLWRFFHTSAEIICEREPVAQRELIGLFKEFFKHFAAMHPCPYCRHHLNLYVVHNREVDLYPLEYLILGRNPDHSDLWVSIDDKLAEVTDGPSLRLFLWKLHNTVSSSIARTEPWYHHDDKAFYTTRYWPSLDSELARSLALNQDSIAVDRLSRVYGLLKPAARLAALRHLLQKMLEAREASRLAVIVDEANSVIAELEAALEAGEFLKETYYFDPTLEDTAPHFTPEEEAYGRSGAFVEA